MPIMYNLVWQPKLGKIKLTSFQCHAEHVQLMPQLRTGQHRSHCMWGPVMCV